jgi:hypothetical protein
MQGRIPIVLNACEQEALSLRKIFRPLVRRGEIVGYPVLLLGSLRSGPQALWDYARGSRRAIFPFLGIFRVFVACSACGLCLRGFCACSACGLCLRVFVHAVPAGSACGFCCMQCLCSLLLGLFCMQWQPLSGQMPQYSRRSCPAAAC